MSHKQLANLIDETSTSRSLWRLAIGLSVAILTLVGYLFLSVGASYDGRLGRDQTRAPVLERLATTNDTNASDEPRVMMRSATLSGSKVVQIVFYANPPKIEAPNGLAAWPQPGEVFVSPAVLADSEGRELISALGTLRGTITAEGLSGPGERLIYVGLDKDKSVIDSSLTFKALHTADELIEGYSGFTGAPTYYQDRNGFYYSLLGFGAFPAIVFLFTALKLGFSARSANIAKLRLIGATPAQIRKLLLSSILKPVLIGAGAACLGLWLGSSFTWKLPFIEQYVVAQDLQSVRWLLPAIAGGAVFAVCLLALFLYRVKKTSPYGTKGLVKPKRTGPYGLLAILGILFFVFVAYANLKQDQEGLANMIVFAGACSTIIFLPRTLTNLNEFIGNALGKKWRGTVGLLASRELFDRARSMASATVFIAIVAILGFQIEMLMTLKGAIIEEYEARTASYSGSVLSLPATDLEAAALQKALPAGVTLLSLTLEENQGEVWIEGDCIAIRELFATECGEKINGGQMPKDLSGFIGGGQEFKLAEISDSSESVMMFVASLSGEPINSLEVTKSIRENLGAMVFPDALHEGWLVGDEIQKQQAQWYGVGAVLAFTIVLQVAIFAIADESLWMVQKIRRLGFYVSKRTFTFRYATAILAVPITLSWALGVLIGIGGVYGPTIASNSAEISATVPVATLALSVVGILTIASYLTFKRADTLKG